MGPRKCIRKSGIMEYWNDGIKGKDFNKINRESMFKVLRGLPNIPVFHHSNF